MPSDRRVVVTGLGCVSALGHTVDSFWSALKEGRCGIGPLNVSAPFDLKVSIGGAIPAPDPSTLVDPRRLAMLDRFSVLALVAAGQAIAQAGISFEGETGARTACVVGVGVAGWEAIEDSYRRVFLEGAKRTNVFTVPRVMPGAPAGQISMAHGVRGPVFDRCPCSSSRHASAVSRIRSGVVDVAIAGGTEAPLVYGILKAWDALRVLAPDTCRPFDRNRRGLALAEAAGIAVLEERRARNVTRCNDPRRAGRRRHERRRSGPCRAEHGGGRRQPSATASPTPDCPSIRSTTSTPTAPARSRTTSRRSRSSSQSSASTRKPFPSRRRSRCTATPLARAARSS